MAVPVVLHEWPPKTIEHLQCAILFLAQGRCVACGDEVASVAASKCWINGNCFIFEEQRKWLGPQQPKENTNA